MSADHNFALNSPLRVALHHLGREHEPVLVFENVLRSPQELVDYAAREVSFAPAYGPGGGYPGVRAPAPLAYVEKLVRSLSPTIEEAFALGNVKLARAECNFSLVTLAPDALAPSQRVPHVDTVDPLQFAFLHYLCDERFGGTAFYRHDATGLEALTAETHQSYETVRAAELAAGLPPPGYIAGETPHFTRTAAFEARFNRTLVYRSRVLHSGQIRSGAPLSADPRTGRLTANVFLNYRPS